jgi:3-oxosteroid 1-dehydrogenase
MPQEDFDLVVLGSGAGGSSAAVSAAAMGLSVCLLEKALLLGGGTAASFGNLWGSRPMGRRISRPRPPRA